MQPKTSGTTDAIRVQRPGVLSGNARVIRVRAKVESSYDRYKAWRKRWDQPLRVLNVASVVIVLNTIVGLALLLPEQSHEALRVLAEDSKYATARLATVWIAAVLLGVMSWWSIRLMLANLHPEARWWKEWGGWFARHVPRAAGCLALFFLALAVLRVELLAGRSAVLVGFTALAPIGIWFLVKRVNNSKKSYSLVSILGAIAVGVFAYVAYVVRGNPLGAVFGLCLFSIPGFYIWTMRRTAGRAEGSPEPNMRESALLFTAIAPVAVSLACFASSVVVPQIAVYIGPGTILLGCAAVWLPLLTILHWLALRLRFPILVAFIACGVLWSWADFNDNHGARGRGQRVARPAPPAFTETFKAWLRSRPVPTGGEPIPVFLVAAEGGGIYAAYYTAQALSMMQDDDATFADHVFAISGVSGGSVGAAVFCALVDQAKGLPTPPPRGWYRKNADEVLKRDLLSPLLTATLLPDMMQRIVPFAVPPLDRARALERTLESAWTAAMETETLAQPFLNLWAKDPHRVPSLLLNTTEVESGERVILTNLSLSPKDFPNLRSALDMDSEFEPPLSTAACLSARFPYVTPAGWIRAPEKPEMPSKRRLVDGGYFENTGIATLLDVDEVLTRIRRNDRNLPPFRIVVVRIGAHDGSAVIRKQGLGESLSPVRALMNTRGARGRDAIRQLERTTGPYEPGETGRRTQRIDFILETHGEYPIPLGWLLSEAARKQINAQIDNQPPLRAEADAPRVMQVPPLPPPRPSNLEAKRQVKELMEQAK